MIVLGEYNMIPSEYILKDTNIVKIIKIISTAHLEKLLEYLEINKFNNLIDVTDIEGNNLVYYLIKYHEKLFKSYVKDNKITHNNFTSNNLNETLLMKLIRESENNNLEQIIIWLFNNFKFNTHDYYTSSIGGSVITYCLKYNIKLLELFVKNSNIIKSLLHVYDTCDMICPYSDNSYEKNIMMNMLYIACIKDYKLLEVILYSDKRITSKIIKEKLKTTNFEHNILSVALFNNPESVQVILRFICNDLSFIKYTDDMIGGFEKIIDIQPASWYYLQEYCNIHNYKIDIDLDSHWYGYNYKQKMLHNNIKKITHFILGKQEIGTKHTMCSICDTYKSKIVLTKCKHKLCIVCSLHSEKCPICRININDEDKILI